MAVNSTYEEITWVLPARSGGYAVGSIISEQLPLDEHLMNMMSPISRPVACEDRHAASERNMHDHSRFSGRVRSAPPHFDWHGRNFLHQWPRVRDHGSRLTTSANCNKQPVSLFPQRATCFYYIFGVKRIHRSCKPSTCASDLVYALQRSLRNHSPTTWSRALLRR